MKKKVVFFILIFNLCYSLFDGSYLIDADSAALQKAEKSYDWLKKIICKKLIEKYRQELLEIISPGFESIQAGQQIKTNNNLKFKPNDYEIISPDGKYIISTESDKPQCKLYSIDSKKCKSIKINNKALFFAFSGDTKHLLIIPKESSPVVYNLLTGNSVKLETEEDLYYPSTGNLNNDGTKAVIGYYNGKVLLWDLKNIKYQEIDNHPEWIQISKFTHDNKFLITLSESTIHIWDFINLKIKAKVDISVMSRVSASEDNNWIASVSDTNPNNITIINVPTLKKVDLVGHTNLITVLTFNYGAHPLDNKYMISGSVDQTVRVWNLNSLLQNIERELPADCTILTGHASGIQHVNMSPDNKFVFSCDKQDVFLWDLTTGQPVSLKRENRKLVSATFQYNRNCCLIINPDGTFQLIDLNNWIINDLNLSQLIVLLKLKLKKDASFLRDPYFKKVFDDFNRDLKKYLTNYFTRHYADFYIKSKEGRDPHGQPIPADVLGLVFQYTGPNLGPEPENFDSDDLVLLNL